MDVRAALLAQAAALRAQAAALEALADDVESRDERQPKAEPLGNAMLSTPELAKRLGVSRAQVHRLAEEGVLPFAWVGDVRRFDLDECIAALKARSRREVPARRESVEVAELATVEGVH